MKHFFKQVPPLKIQWSRRGEAEPIPHSSQPRT